MKTLITVLMLTTSLVSTAATLKPINKATNAKVQRIYSDLAAEFNKPRNCLDLKLVKVLAYSDAKGRSLEDVRKAMVKETFHRFVTQWFDDGIDTNDFKTAQDIDKNMSEFQDEQGNENKLMASDLKSALLDKTLNVYGGGAGGNNTSGSVFSIFDTKNNEIMTLTTSNFASDDGCAD